MGSTTAAYDAAPLRVPMKPSPSAIYCNLAAAGQSLFYAHGTEACAVQPAGAVAQTPISVRRVECNHQDVGFIHTVKALPHGDTGYILLATEGGVQIWDKMAHYLLFVWSSPSTAAATKPDEPAADSAAAQVSGTAASEGGVGIRHQLFARGACINIATDGTANICFGASNGTLHVLQVDDQGRFTGPYKFSNHKAPITALGSAYQARQGRWTDDMSSSLVSADESGKITVWKADAAAAYSPAYELGASTGSRNTPAVGLAVRSDFVVAARLDGTIQLLSMRDKSLRAEIVAHSRWLSSMDIHPTKDLLVTGAEDGSIAVWTLPIGAQKATSLLSCVWMHGSVAGVVFCGPTLDDVAAVAYDTDELQIFKPNRPT